MDPSFRTTYKDLLPHLVFSFIKARLTRDRSCIFELSDQLPDTLPSHESPSAYTQAHIKHTDELRRCDPHHSTSNYLAFLLRFVSGLDLTDVAQHFIAVKYKDEITDTNEITNVDISKRFQKFHDLFIAAKEKASDFSSCAGLSHELHP